MISIYVLIILLILVVIISNYSAWWRSTVSYKHPRILMYHMVREPIEGAKFNKLRVAPNSFEQQISWLKATGWRFGLMSEIEEGRLPPEKSIFITFDDGYEDNYTNAHRILKKYEAKATLYLVSDRFERDWSTNKKAHHNSGELMREPKLTDDQVREMVESGCWELGGHTVTHANLTKLSPSEKLDEMQRNKRELEEKFNIKVSSFAYPFGIYDDGDVDAVKNSGFKTAVTTASGIVGLSAPLILELPRLKISGKDSFITFRSKIRTGYRGFKQ